MAKRYKNVVDMTRDLTDPKFADELEAEIRVNNVPKIIAVARSLAAQRRRSKSIARRLEEQVDWSKVVEELADELERHRLAVQEMLRWWALWPEFVPNPEFMESAERAVAFAHETYGTTKHTWRERRPAKPEGFYLEQSKEETE
jgi:hypothetical protein